MRIPCIAAYGLTGHCQAAAGIGFTIQNEALETIEEPGAMDQDQRTRRRLASTWPIQSSREIVNTLYRDCGSMAVFEGPPSLSRYFHPL